MFSWKTSVSINFASLSIATKKYLLNNYYNNDSCILVHQLIYFTWHWLHMICSDMLHVFICPLYFSGKPSWHGWTSVSPNRWSCCIHSTSGEVSQSYELVSFKDWWYYLRTNLLLVGMFNSTLYILVYNYLTLTLGTCTCKGSLPTSQVTHRPEFIPVSVA